MRSDLSQFLRPMAAKYIWWKTPDEALKQPARIIAQVMYLGEFCDVEKLTAAVGDETLRDVLTHAEPGYFDERSWDYWHYRLGLAEPEHVPAMPRRVFV